MLPRCSAQSGKRLTVCKLCFPDPERKLQPRGFPNRSTSFQQFFWLGESLTCTKGVMDTLHELLVDELKDLHSAETQLVKALPKMAKKAASESLRDAILAHLEE